MQIKPVRIIISTATSELDSDAVLGDLAFAEIGYDIPEQNEKDGKDDDDTPVVFESDGIMTYDGGDIRISYIERLADGGDNHTVICFREDRPTSVSMISGGSGPTALVFDSEKRRCGCIYNIGPFPFEVTVCTETMTNTITYKNGGKLYAEYTVEIRGVAAEFDRVTVKVEPLQMSNDDLLERYSSIIDSQDM